MSVELPFPKSLPEFQKLFPDDAHCAAYMERVRWPDGFVCPSCETKGEPGRVATRSHVLRCKACKKEARLTANTVMQDSHTPLLTWFWGAYLVASLTPGMSAVQFQRQLGLNRYETAYQILHKLRAGMVRRDVDMIGGVHTVELDETWVGGKTRGEGKGTHHQTLVVGAVEVRKRQGPKPSENVFGEQSKAIPKRGGRYAGRLRLAVVPDRTSKTLVGFARMAIEPGSDIITDDWAAYGKLKTFDFKHHPFAENGDPAVAEEHLPLIHLVFSNLKAWLLGVHHGVAPQHLQAYLNEFTFRFNRRFFPFTSFRSLLGIGADSESATYAELYSGDWEHPSFAVGG
jgi:transposase-like protein